MARAVALVLVAGLLGVPAAGAAGEATITVTTRTDAVNGVVESVAELLAQPGPDGISLREALTATNNDPGEYEIRFAPALAGKTIGIRGGEELPALAGGGVTLDGDIDGNGRPDVTILGSCTGLQWGLAIASSGNTVRALTLRKFGSGVVFMAGERGLSKGRTIAGNLVQGLVLDVCENGIWLQAAPSLACERRACATKNSWLDTRIVGNTIQTRISGIELQLSGTIGERIQRLTIADNRLTFKTKGGEFNSGFGVHVLAGGASGGDRANRISGVTISGNRVTGNPSGGVRIAVGDSGADANAIEGVRIVGNRFQIRPPASGNLSRSGITLATGDACSDFHAPRLQPLRCPERNLLQNVEISRNTLGDGAGVTIFAGAGGATRNTVRGVRILRNTIKVRIPTRLEGLTLHTLPGVLVMAGITQATTGKPTTRNRVHDLSIVGNRIALAKGQRPAAGVILLGGRKRGATGNSLTCVRVSGNRITGFPRPVSLLQGLEDASGNTATLGGC